MGYAHYEITRNGKTIQAGYGVETVCEEKGCKEKVDRGLGCLCGKTPGGDEYGCGGYYCGNHLLGDNQCETCSHAADLANQWIHPGTREEFDLRDRFLPAGSLYDARGTVWRYAGVEQNSSPVLEPISTTGDPADGRRRLLSEGEWEDAARVADQRMQETSAAA